MAAIMNVFMERLLDMVEQGALDGDLDTIVSAVSNRRAILALQAGARMTPGTVVQFANVPDNKDGWVGVRGIVEGKARGGKAVKIKLAENTEVRRVGRRRDPIRPGQVWTVPTEWLEVIS